MLGPVIAQLKDNKNAIRLLDFYFQMIEPSLAKLGNGNEMMENCAFNFPAVLWATLSEVGWPKFHKLYKYMLQNGGNKVREPLISSLHEIAKMIGPEQAEQSLFPVFDRVFKENSID